MNEYEFVLAYNADVQANERGAGRYNPINCRVIYDGVTHTESCGLLLYVNTLQHISLCILSGKDNRRLTWKRLFSNLLLVTSSYHVSLKDSVCI